METASEMWSSVQSLLQRRTVLHRGKVRRRFHAVKMNVSERVIQYISLTKQPATNMKLMDVDVHEQELAMTIFVGCRESLNISKWQSMLFRTMTD